MNYKDIHILEAQICPVQLDDFVSSSCNRQYVFASVLANGCYCHGRWQGCCGCQSSGFGRWLCRAGLQGGTVGGCGSLLAELSLAAGVLERDLRGSSWPLLRRSFAFPS